MHCLLLICFNSKPLHVSIRFTAHHEEGPLCINSSWCLYRVDPPDDEQQASSKHVEAYYWNTLIENSAPCWFMLYGFILKIRRNKLEKTMSTCFFATSPAEDSTAYGKDPVWCRIYYTGAPNLFCFNNNARDPEKYIILRHTNTKGKYV